MKRILTGWLLLCCWPALAAPISAWTLANGARVLLVESRAIPVIDISISLDAGARRDPADLSGVAAMTRRMLTGGLAAVNDEPALTESQVSDAMADTAADLDGSTGMDRASMTLRVLSNPTERDAAIRLFGRMLAQPRFPENVLLREKTRAIAAVREADTKPASIADRVFMRTMYGDHPYAHKPTAASVDRIARADIVRFHGIHYVSNRMVVAIVGDVTREQADVIAVELTRRLPRAEAALPAMPAVPAPQMREARVAHPASQAHILIGMPALSRGDPDYFALTVGNYTLGGGGFASRMVHEVREKRGLSYSVSSSFSPMLQPGPFQIGMQTQKKQTNDALNVSRETLAAYLRDGPTPDEIKAAKNYLVGSFALRLDSNRKILDHLAIIGFYDLPLDYLETWKSKIESVTTEDVRNAFRRKLATEKMVTVIVGAPEQP